MYYLLFDPVLCTCSPNAIWAVEPPQHMAPFLVIAGCFTLVRRAHIASWKYLASAGICCSGMKRVGLLWGHGACASAQDCMISYPVSSRCCADTLAGMEKQDIAGPHVGSGNTGPVSSWEQLSAAAALLHWVCFCGVPNAGGLPCSAAVMLLFSSTRPPLRR